MCLNLFFCSRRLSSVLYAACSPSGSFPAARTLHFSCEPAVSGQHVGSNLSMALRFEVIGRFNRARASQLTLPHYVCHTPLFMPVGTQGTIKGLAYNQLEDIGCQIILGNTYHLALRPTAELLDDMGGLHKFMNWDRALLTDSGGFQMVSLLHLADITEKGVTFQSPADGQPMLLTPEESIQIQNKIGADIIMALDDVVKTTITGPRVEEAMYRTLRWIDRCIAAHQRPHDQNLFGIVQGGLDPVLRDICVKGLVERNLPGYAIGGLSGGEDKDSFWRVVAQCTAALPEDKPRYVMGVGYPLDIVVCSALGADMYDCVYPTRTARFGTALVPERCCGPFGYIETRWCSEEEGRLQMEQYMKQKELWPHGHPMRREV
ncbi:uncharacterized protein LOC144711223 isoform X2 [Wolffia australiana]